MDKEEFVATFQGLLKNPAVEDLVLNPRGLFVYIKGQWKEESPKPSQEVLREWSKIIAENSGQSLGLTQPTVDAYFLLEDDIYFRAHVAISPFVLEGPVLTLRRLPRLKSYSLAHFHIDPALGSEIKNSVSEGKSFLVCGGTGSGKTTFLTCLLSQLPATERVLILEDSPELPLPNTLSSKLLCRNDRFGFRSGAHWDLCHLLFESLRMRPDRLVLGECRGKEAFAVQQALQTGHRGIFTTLHAGSCEQGLERFHNLCKSHPDGALTKNENLWDYVLYFEEDESGRRELKESFKR